MRYKRDFILLGIMVITAICAVGLTIFFNPNHSLQKKNVQITASFYPMYIIARNITDGMDNVSLSCMAQNQTGCLHDYQITTTDMKVLESTDIFIINGGGMESFLEDIVLNYPMLHIVDAGKEFGISESAKEELFDKEEHSHKEEHDHKEEINAHFWLNPAYYILQVQTIADELAKLDQDHAKQYQDNAKIYIEKVRKLANKMQTELEVPNIGVIVFHDAFVYLAEYLGLSVVHTMEIDSETSLNAGEIAEIMEQIQKGNVEILFTEAQYSTRIADTIGKETNVAVYVIDSLVTGKEDKDSYLRGMESNLELLKQAFSKKADR